MSKTPLKHSTPHQGWSTQYVNVNLPWALSRRKFLKRTLFGPALGCLLPCLVNQVYSQIGSCDQGPVNPPSSTMYDLDENAADWGIFCEGAPLWVKGNVSTPSLDGNALWCGVTGGMPFSNVHCYRNLLPDPSATVFTLTLSFWFSPTTTFNNVGGDSIVQALEFSMSKWQEAKRYEFALQWQNVGAGGPQWRYWDPLRPASERWVSLTIPETLAGEQWHTFTLEGEIINGQVYYRNFTIDQRSYGLGILVPPAATPGEPDRLAMAVQLDGNFTQSPYDLFIDKVSFVR